MKRERNLSLFIVVLISMVNISYSTECHPQCSWKCDDPHCPAICDPVCEPPKCHTSCAEPKNAICDVKCEKPQCEIKCPDKGCEMFDCPKCVTVCKQPHCVTHCQAPKPECEAVCEETKCDWKCHKPNCPKPKCELVCENPNCTPKVECCPCVGNVIGQIPSFPFFKETEQNNRCCSCKGKPQGSSPTEYPKVDGLDPALMNIMPSTGLFNSADNKHFYKIDKRASVEMFKQPRLLGTGQYTSSHHPKSHEYLSHRDHLNLNLAYKDRK